MNWADCSCCWPQKPKIRKAIGWTIIGATEADDELIDPFWYLEIGGWPKGNYDTWPDALKAAKDYLSRETY